MRSHRVLETLSSTEGHRRLSALLASEKFPHRTAVAKCVCHEFGFLDPRGRPQVSACLKALRALDARGAIKLAPAVRGVSAGKPRRLGKPSGLGRPVPAPRSVPGQVGQVEQLRLRLVRTRDQSLIWNDIIRREHYLGAAREVETQLRYLIHSAHGYLGTIGFSASTLEAAPRDRFIGWEASLRRSHLHRVLNLSRFLIRPSVRCRGLASKALALCCQRLADDFRPRYGYAPYLLETFVDTSRHSGACLKAANWMFVGNTAGRSRHAPASQRASVKSVFVIPLQSDWRRRLGVPPAPPPPEPRDGLDTPHWARQEFGHAPLGDARLSRRLVQVAALSATDPGATFAFLAKSDSNALRGYYNLIGRPAHSRLTPANMLAPHRTQTLQRMRRERTVLWIQDSTDLSFSKQSPSRLRELAENQADWNVAGWLRLRATLAVSTEGVPLGLPLIQYEGLGGAEEEEDKARGQRWARELRDCCADAAELGVTRVVAVLDQVAEVFDAFDARRQTGAVDLLVRAQHNRWLGKREPRLHDVMPTAKVRRMIFAPRSPAGPGARRHDANRECLPRMAKVALRWRTLRLAAPYRRRGEGLQPVTLSVVFVREEPSPDEMKPLEWYLVTNVPVRTPSDANRILDWYLLRWRIKHWHRVLKSGCKVETLRHRKRERVERAVTIKAVIAWRLTMRALMGLDTPELPASTLLSEPELAALEDFAADQKLPAPDNLGQAVRAMAQLGGYPNRKDDPPPGNRFLREGYMELVIIAEVYERVRALGKNSSLFQAVPIMANYGEPAGVATGEPLGGALAARNRELA